MATHIEEEEELDQKEWDGRTHRRAAFIAGAVAGMAMTIVMLILIIITFIKKFKIYQIKIDFSYIYDLAIFYLFQTISDLYAS